MNFRKLCPKWIARIIARRAGYRRKDPRLLACYRLDRCWNGVPIAWWGGYNTRSCEIYKEFGHTDRRKLK